MKRILMKFTLMLTMMTIFCNSVLLACASTTNPIVPITEEKSINLMDNYVENSGFETGISNMTGGAGTRSWETTVEKGDGTTVSPYEGNYAFKLSKTAAGGYATTTDISVVPNTVYIAKEMLFKKSGTGNVGGKTYANLDSVKDSANAKVTVTTYESVTNFTTTDNWQQHELVFNTNSAVKLRLGLNSAGVNTVVYADDFYLSPLRMAGTVTGLDIIPVLASDKTYAYSVTVKNQLGTTTGVSGDYMPTVTWSVEGAPVGVFVDSQTGILTVASTALRQTVVLCANISSPLKENGVQDITVHKEILIDKLPDASEVTLDKNELSLYKGETDTLKATVLPENAADKSVTWSSSNENVATVDENGTVSALSSGQAEITVTTSTGIFDTCVVTVPEDVDYVTSVTLDKSTLTMKVGESQKLSATILPKNSTVKNVQWESDNELVCTISVDGTVTPIGEGTANITAKAGEVTANCSVDVIGYSDEYFVVSTYQNLFPNGDFEEGHANGFKEDVARIEINSDEDGVYEGNYSAHFIGSDTKGTGYVQMKNVPVTPNTVYFANVWMNRKGGTKTIYSVDGAKGTKGGMDGYLELKDNWKPYTFWYKTAADETTLNLTYATIGLSASAYVDDFVFTKFNLKNEISGPDEITRPQTGKYTQKYSTVVTNPIGTEAGIEEPPFVMWYLKNKIDDVKINTLTGEITVGENAPFGEIELYCRASSYNNSVDAVLSGISKKVISVVPVRAKAENLVINAISSEMESTLTATYEYSHPEQLNQSGSRFLWSVSDSKDDGYAEYSTDISCRVSKDISGKYVKFAVVPVGTDQVDGKPLESEPIKIEDLFVKTPVMLSYTLKADSKVGVGTKISADITWETELGSSYECEWYYSDDTRISDEKTEEYTFRTEDVGKNIYAKIYPYTKVSVFKIYGEAKQSSILNGPVKPIAENVSVFGVAAPGNIVTGKYTYKNINNLAEGASVYSWTINGRKVADTASYTLQSSDAGGTVVFTVTPVSADGTVGEPVSSTASSVSSGVFSSISVGTGGGGGGGFSPIPSVPSVTPSIQTAPSQSGAFSDISGHWAENEIKLMAQLGIASGTGDHKFTPDEKITRAQLIAFVVRGLKLGEADYQGIATDMAAGSWYEKVIGTAVEKNLIQDSSLIRPNDYITREEMTKIIVNAYELKKTINTDGYFHPFEDDISEWAVDYVTKATREGLVFGITENQFGAKQNATRAQGIVMVKRLLDKI